MISAGLPRISADTPMGKKMRPSNFFARLMLTMIIAGLAVLTIELLLYNDAANIIDIWVATAELFGVLAAIPGFIAVICSIWARPV